MRHRCQAPESDGEREAAARAEPIHEPAHQDEAQRVGGLKPEDDVAVGDFVPAQLRFESRLQDANYLAINVIDCGGEKEERTDRPTEIADVRACLIHFADYAGIVGAKESLRYSRWSLSLIYSLR